MPAMVRPIKRRSRRVYSAVASSIERASSTLTVCPPSWPMGSRRALYLLVSTVRSNGPDGSPGKACNCCTRASTDGVRKVEPTASQLPLPSRVSMVVCSELTSRMSVARRRSIGKAITIQPMVIGAFTGITTTW